MTRLDFTVTLVSDGEPGSGFGTATVNALVPRDARGRPYIPASHLKGLLRDRLDDLADTLGWPGDLPAAVLGGEGRDGGDGLISCVRLTDATSASTSSVHTITRTAVGDLGTVVGTSLRSSEAIAAGTRFTGSAFVEDAPGGAADLAVRAGLLSIAAVGGGRMRGCGACQVTLEGESRSPGALLSLLHPLALEGIEREPSIPAGAGEAVRALADGEPAVLRVIWRAQGPVCCPETPVVGNNVIRSGFAIPASAVQGALLSWLTRLDEALGNACFADARFRAWPLLPCGRADEADVPVAVRVSLTHRMSKLAGDDGRHEFRDSMIEPYDWRTVAAGSPLKAADGVLLTGGTGDVQLWRAADMPRLVTAHGVHADPAGRRERNLFTVESMAPLAFSGWVSLPREAASALLDDLVSHPETTLALGKARSIRGNGTVTLEPAAEGVFPGTSLAKVFVVQSPVAIPDEWEVEDAGKALARIVADADWGEVEHATAHVGIRFGWNRHEQGDRVGSSRRLRARKVILPGSVFQLAAPPAPRAVRRRLVEGIGAGRDQGFGAVLPHPGIARERYLPRPPLLSVRSVDEAGKLGMDLWRLASPHGPTPSQIAALAARVSGDPAHVLDYLERQMKERPERIYRCWRDVAGEVEQLVRRDAALAARALRVWQDLAVAERGEEGRR